MHSGINFFRSTAMFWNCFCSILYKQIILTFIIIYLVSVCVFWWWWWFLFVLCMLTHPPLLSTEYEPSQTPNPMYTPELATNYITHVTRQQTRLNQLKQYMAIMPCSNFFYIQMWLLKKQELCTVLAKWITFHVYIRIVFDLQTLCIEWD